MTQPTQNASSPIRIAGLISGGGSTILNIAHYIQRGELPAEISIVICSNTNAKGIERLRAAGLDVQIVPRKEYDSTQAFSTKVWSLIHQANVDLVCLGGFLSLLRIPDEFTNRVMNVHPALLPAFGGSGLYGYHVHEAVLAAHSKVSGCTVHFADDEYDNGPIIIQRTCPVEENDTPDTLAERVMTEERIAFPQAIRLFAEGRLKVQGQSVQILPG